MSSPFNEFETQYKAGKTQLVTRWISGDLETPVSAYLKLCQDKSNCILLESIEGGATLGRYSVIGFDPDLIWKDSEHKDPLTSLKQTIKDCHIDVVPDGLPPMAASGLFGYIGYDMVRLVEDIPDNNPDDLGIPQSILMRPQALVIFDNIKNMICLVTPIYRHAQNHDADAKAHYNAVIEHLDKIENDLQQAVPAHLLKSKTNLTSPLEVSSNTTREEYHATVKKAVDYIHQGEIFQVVPGQRFSVDFDLPAFDLYRALRKLNPSPFMVHLTLEDFSLVASSPEILVRVRGGTVTIRPIAGTRKRGKDAAEDAALAEDLLSDPKERAEHLMLLDLGRNDVGRVSEFGSV